MKKQLIVLVSLLLFTAKHHSQSFPPHSNNPGSPEIQTIGFTENRGQVHDQFNRPRPDVLYGATAGGLSVHIKRSGVSYQLSKADGYSQIKDFRTQQYHRVNDRMNTWRIDLSWVSPNSTFSVLEDEALPGYENYYLESCPAGAVMVRTFRGVTLKDLYPGISVHYYEKHRELKHDYIVAPHADYTQIKLKVSGAEVSLNADGSLLFTTPMGNIHEGAPKIFQKGRQLNGKWTVRNGIIGFEVEQYDSNYELIIDPITRIWGTYYGGTSLSNGVDYGFSCRTDNSGNVYLTGATASNTGTVIATSGSHQSSYVGGYDAYLAKFSSAGVRLWATYYGGSGQELAYGCAADASDNVYMSGQASSQTFISTVGSHQLMYAGGAYDGFLVKFNSNGVRLWGTYCGGPGDDYPQSCATDPSGNVYVSGATTSTSGLSTSGSHQPSSGGGMFECFLVKFSGSGSRQWGTFYGGAGDDRTWGCATDAGGNVFLPGFSTTNTGTVIATTGSHQPALGTGTGAFLAKFNSSGTRQWGTYFGTTGEWALDCAADPSGNVFISGVTYSMATLPLATPGSHQSSFGGGFSDAFLAKFDGNGVQQWTTFYGGTGDENGQTCAADAAGNIYMAGLTSSSVGVSIATPGSHQTVFGGGAADAFLVKFDANGNRQSGTYYGAANQEQYATCAVNNAGEVYLAGSTPSGTGTAIATLGSHQPSYGGGNLDAYLVKFDPCDTPPPQPSPITASATCAGKNNIFTSAPAVGTSTYTWSLPSGWTGTTIAYSILVTPGSAGIFTVIAGNLCGVSPERTVSVMVHANPLVTASSGTICSGQSFTLAGSGASTYTYSAGPVVSPLFTTSYTITGTDTAGCMNTAVSTVTVLQLPSVFMSNGAICPGQTFTLSATGASTYSYSSGPVVSPSVSTIYYVTGTDNFGCSKSATTIVIVNPAPDINVTTTHSTLCAGETATLTADGAMILTFEQGGPGPTLVISPTVTTSYTVSGTASTGCTNTAVFTQSVDACTGIGENGPKDLMIRVYPNPTNDLLNLVSRAPLDFTICNSLGQTVGAGRIREGTCQIDLGHLSGGVYILRAIGNSGAGEYIIVKN